MKAYTEQCVLVVLSALVSRGWGKAAEGIQAEEATGPALLLTPSSLP